MNTNLNSNIYKERDIPPTVNLINDVYQRMPGVNPTAERRMAPISSVDIQNGNTVGSEEDFPKIYVTRQSHEFLRKNVPPIYINTDTTLLTDIVEHTIQNACCSLPEYRGRKFRVVPGTNRVIDHNMCNSEILPNGRISVKNRSTPPGCNQLMNSSFVRGYEYNPENGELFINIQTETFELEKRNEKNSKDIKRLYLKNKINKNLSINIVGKYSAIKDVSDREKRALETLREIITEKEFRKYIKCGFLIVKAKSGKYYQIFRDKWHTKVWKEGRLVEEICVRIKTSINVPPTDNVIAFKIMIDTNEDEFRKCGNVYNLRRKAA